MTMAQHAAAIGRVNLDRLRDGGMPEGRTGKNAPDNGLQVAVGQAAQWFKRGEPLTQSGSMSRA
jgi:hypothetical protein